jgi:hypothetical protein
MDHLVLAAPDLDEGVEYVEELLGVNMVPGGEHEGFGTRNRLLGLGERSYLEVVSIDPEQPDPKGSRWFGLDDLAAPRLVTWCCEVAKEGSLSSLNAVIEAGAGAGIDLGRQVAGSRLADDGSMIRWTMSDPWKERAGGVIPFFIDWGATTHPASRLAAECSLVELRLEHPDAERVEDWLWFLGLDAPVFEGPEPRLIAKIDSPKGVVELV